VVIPPAYGENIMVKPYVLDDQGKKKPYGA